MNEDPHVGYHAALRRERVKTAGAVVGLIVGAPAGAVVGFAANRALLGDYGGQSEIVFAVTGAVACSVAFFVLARLVIVTATSR